jgi:LysR family transcriptional activator of glutamate synthase operon
MNTSQLQCFMAVASTLSFTRAADQLYKTQSVISRQIRSLEDELGIVLFERCVRGVQLTSAGAVVLDGVKRMLGDLDETVRRAKAVQSGLDGELRICVPVNQMTDAALSAIIRGFKKLCPDIRLRLRAENPSETTRMLLDGHIDFAYSRTGEFSYYKNVENIHINTYGNCMVLPPDYSFGKKDTENLRFSDFSDATFIVLPDEDAPSHRRSIENEIIKCGVKPKLYIAENLGSVGLLVETGGGVSVLNCMNTLISAPNIKYVYLDDFPKTEYSLLWNTDFTSPCANAFISFVSGYMQRHPVHLTLPDPLWRI